MSFVIVSTDVMERINWASLRARVSNEVLILRDNLYKINNACIEV